ncbi:MAG: hypothetical protein ACWGQW_23435 [bacterium]
MGIFSLIVVSLYATLSLLIAGTNLSEQEGGEFIMHILQAAAFVAVACYIFGTL